MFLESKLDRFGINLSFRADNKQAIEKNNEKRVCRICKEKIEPSKLLSHSSRCLKIMDLYKTLFETNNWLLEKCKEANKLKNVLGFDTLMRHSHMQKKTEKWKAKRSKNLETRSVKNSEDDQKSTKTSVGKASKKREDSPTKTKEESKSKLNAARNAVATTSGPPVLV